MLQQLQNSFSNNIKYGGGGGKNENEKHREKKSEIVNRKIVNKYKGGMFGKYSLAKNEKKENDKAWKKQRINDDERWLKNIEEHRLNKTK